MLSAFSPMRRNLEHLGFVFHLPHSSSLYRHCQNCCSGAEISSSFGSTLQGGHLVAFGAVGKVHEWEPDVVFIFCAVSCCSVPLQGSLASGTSPSSARWRSWLATAPSRATTSSAVNPVARKPPPPPARRPPSAPALPREPPLPALLCCSPPAPLTLLGGDPGGTLLQHLGLSQPLLEGCLAAVLPPGGCPPRMSQAGASQPGNPLGTIPPWARGSLLPPTLPPSPLFPPLPPRPPEMVFTGGTARFGKEPAHPQIPEKTTFFLLSPAPSQLWHGFFCFFDSATEKR